MCRLKKTTHLAVLGLHCCERVLSSCRNSSLVVARGLSAVAFCRSWAQQLWCTGVAAPPCVAPSWTRDQTCVPCTSRHILYHWSTGEVRHHIFKRIKTRHTHIYLRSSLRTRTFTLKSLRVPLNCSHSSSPLELIRGY